MQLDSDSCRTASGAALSIVFPGVGSVAAVAVRAEHVSTGAIPLTPHIIIIVCRSWPGRRPHRGHRRTNRDGMPRKDVPWSLTGSGAADQRTRRSAVLQPEQALDEHGERVADE